MGVTADAQLGPSGKTLAIVFRDDLGTPADLETLNLNGLTLTVNGGAPLALTDPLWGPDTTHSPAVPYLPFVVFPLTDPVADDATATLHAPDGWATTTLGSVVAGDLAVGNQVGGSFLPDLVESTKTMRVGTNLLFPVYYLPQNMYANIMAQGQAISNGDALGYPTTFPVAVQLVVSGTDSTDPLRYPVTAADGVWTLIWDGDYDANLKLSSSFSVINQLLSDTPGVNNRNHTRTYRITTKLTDRHCPIITLTLVAAGATNVRVYPPGEATDGSQLFGGNFLRQATGYQCLRFMNSTMTGFSPVIDYADFATPDQFTFQPLPATAVGGPVVSLDPYERTDDFFDPAMCAFVVTFAEPHGATTGQILQFNSGIAAPNSDGTFPTTAGGTMSQINMGRCLVRVLDATRVATQHFASGGGGTFTASYPQTGITFAMPRKGGMPPEHCATLSSLLDADAWINVPHAATDACVTDLAEQVVANLAPGLKCYLEYTNEHWNTANSFEQNQYIGALGRTMPGTGAAATAVVDATSRAITGLTLTSSGTGYLAAPTVTIAKSPTGQTATAHATFVEGVLALVLDSGGSGFDPANPPAVTIDPALDLTTTYTWRAGQVHALFASVFAAAGRGGDLVRVMGTQYSSPNGPTAKIANAAVRNGIAFDALAGAPYWDNSPGKSEPSLADAFDRFDVDMLHDFNQICMIYGIKFDPLTTHRAILDAAGLTDVQLVCYEGGPQDGTPLGVNDRIHRSRAWARHPRMRPLMLYYLQRLQDAGVTLYVDFILNYTVSDSENRNSSGGSPANWATYFGREQVAGTGDGSDGLFDNRTNYFDTSEVVSVKGDALATWADLASSPTAPDGGETPPPTEALAAPASSQQGGVAMAADGAFAAYAGFDADFQVDCTYLDPADGIEKLTAFLASDTLGGKVWPGGDLPDLFTPTLTWIDPGNVGSNLYRVKVSFAGTDTASLAPGLYQVLGWVVAGGVKRPLFAAPLQILPAGGSAVAPLVYCSGTDLTNFGGGRWFRKLQTAESDETDFLADRGRAAAWIHEQILAEFRARQLDHKRRGGPLVNFAPIFAGVGYDQGPDWGPSAQPDYVIRDSETTLRGYLAAGQLMSAGDTRLAEIAARYTLYLVTDRQPGLAEKGISWDLVARKFQAQAIERLVGWVARIDTDADGVADFELRFG